MDERLDNTPPRRRDARWRARYLRVAAIAEKLGRLPRRSDPVDPADVAWIADQRRATALTSAQRLHLARLPGWTDGTRDGAWYLRAEELRSHLRAHGTLPRIRSDDPNESALAHWLSRQRVSAVRGSLSEERASALAYVLSTAADESQDPSGQPDV